MAPARIIILAVAAVSALGLAFVVRGMTSRDEAPAVVQTAEKPSAKVLVASRDLPVGARLAPGDLSWQSWPLDAVNDAYITDGSVALPAKVLTEEEKAAEKARADAKYKLALSEWKAEVRKAEKAGVPPPPEPAKPDAKPEAGAADAVADAEKNAGEVADAARSLFGEGGPMDALTGAVVREALMKGDPVTERKLVRAGESGVMAVVLTPGMRAMSIPVSVESAAGGFILPGDRVDVVLSRQVQVGQEQEFRSETVMRNVKILAIDQTTKPEDGAQTVVGATATLEVGADDAEALALADAQGDLALVLRSYADVDGPSGRTARPQLTRAGPTGAAGRTVRVWRDGQATAVAVQ
jgi:pilus assembly protein CpaB